MHIAGDHIRHDAFRQHRPRRSEGKTAKTVADVKDDTAPMRLQNILADAVAARHRRIRKRAEAMRQHIAGAQRLQHLFAAGRWKVDMRHHRQIEFFCHLDRQQQRRKAGTAARLRPHPRLDADDQIKVLLGKGQTFPTVQQPQILAFTHHHVLGETKNTGERDVQIGQNPRRCRFNDKFSQASKVACTGAARIDKRRGAAALGNGFRIHPQRGRAPIHMGMHVDQARRHDAPRHIANLPRRAAKIGPDRRH